MTRGTIQEKKEKERKNARESLAELDRKEDPPSISKKSFQRLSSTWEISSQKLVFKDPPVVLGKGAFGTVSLASLFGVDVAVKSIQTDSDSELSKFISRELSILRTLHYPHIIHFYGICEEDSQIHVVMEYANRGTLRQHLKNEKLGWKIRLKWATQGAGAMSYLHSKKVIHRDLKSKNFLITEHFECKLCDFGFARVTDTVQKAKPDYMTLCGTEEWMAPEILLGMAYDERADIFSFGIVLCEIITQKKIKQHFQRSPQNGFSFPVKDFEDAIPINCPKKLVDLALLCVHDDSKKRPEFGQIHETLKQIYEELPEDDSDIESLMDIFQKQESPRSTLMSKESRRLEKKEKSYTKLNSELLFNNERALHEFSDIFFSEKKDESKNYKLLITNYRVIISLSHDKKNEVHEAIPLLSIFRVQKEKGYIKENRKISIFCSNFVKYHLYAVRKTAKAFLAALKASSISARKELFAFKVFTNLDMDGWHIYDEMKEYKRMEIPSNQWRITTINTNFEWCPSYPQSLVVPYFFPDEYMKEIVGWQHIPVLSWKNPKNNAVLLRSGELSKIKDAEGLLLTSIKNNNSRQAVTILLTEKTKSISKIENYNCVSLGIEAHDSVLNFYQKLLGLCFSDDEVRFFIGLDNTHLMQNLKQIIGGSLKIVDLIESGETCIVMSRNGCDRATQLIALAELLLDPYYRTIEGFAVLVEKEWCSFENRLYDRFILKKDSTPLLLEWIDAVWQITCQFPHSFEFSESMLIEMVDHIFYGFYGTFLCNGPQQRNQLEKTSISFWSHIKDNMDHYRNILFDPSIEGILVPNVSLKSLRFWNGFYGRMFQPSIR